MRARFILVEIKIKSVESAAQFLQAIGVGNSAVADRRRGGLVLRSISERNRDATVVDDALIRPDAPGVDELLGDVSDGELVVSIVLVPDFYSRDSSVGRPFDLQIVHTADWNST
jgi:hypothetical protein